MSFIVAKGMGKYTLCGSRPSEEEESVTCKSDRFVARQRPVRQRPVKNEELPRGKGSLRGRECGGPDERRFRGD